jgi:lysophospholipase L1-like esterase
MRMTAGPKGVFIAVAALALLTIAPAAGARAEGSVLIVGDSLEELTSPHIAQHLPPGTELTVNAAGGYNSFQVYDLFAESYDPSQSVIVFDGGTNDNPNYPEILAGNLTKVAETVGDRCLVVPTIHGYTVEGVNNDGKNRVVREFAASRPGTQVPDWASFEESHPELMQSDDLHPTEEGAEARAELIAQGIVGCLNGASTELGFGGGDGASASSAPPPAPILDQAPAPIETVDKLSRREDEMLRAMGVAMARQAVVVLFSQGALPR